MAEVLLSGNARAACYVTRSEFMHSNKPIHLYLMAVRVTAWVGAPPLSGVTGGDGCTSLETQTADTKTTAHRTGKILILDRLNSDVN